MEVFFYQNSEGLLSVSKNDISTLGYTIRIGAREISEDDWQRILAFTPSKTGPENTDLYYREISTFLRQFVRDGVVNILDADNQDIVALVA